MVGMSMSGKYDLAIVGGGIIGAWALYLASRRYPDWRIILIERFKVGDGATAHSAGVSLPIGRSAREQQLAANSARLYQEVHESLRFGTTKTDVFWVTNLSDKEALRNAAVGFAIEDTSMTADELGGRIEMPLHLDAAEIILRGGTAVAYDPGQVARTLVEASLRAANVRCIEGMAVKSIQPSTAGAELLQDDGTIVSALRTLVTVGPWMIEGPVDAFSREHSVRVKKVVALHLDQVPPRDAATVVFPQSDAFLLPLWARNQWLFSFRSDEWDCLPRKHTLEISGRDRELAQDILECYLPGMSQTCRGGRVFCDAYSTDGVPLVKFDSSNQTIVAGACSGSGFRLAPGIADEALRMFPSVARSCGFL